MKVIKKFTALEVKTQKVNDAKVVELQFGNEGYMVPSIETEFDTEDEAIQYAHKMNKYGNWLIVPIIRFEYPWLADE